MDVPFLDVKATHDELSSEITTSIKRVLESGIYILGPEVEAFEKEFAEYTSVNFSVGVASGLDALILSLKALEIGPGDEVIVPSHTFIATWLAVSAVGATPVPVEPDKRTLNIDIKKIPQVITKHTRAIIPVHLYGLPVALDDLIAIASSHKLFIIEDAAQAHGATYKGRPIGGHGDLCCWSFYPGKNLGAYGDAGAITTNSSKLAKKIKALRNYGSLKKYEHKLIGHNSRLDPIQAAILRVKLNHLDSWNMRRRMIAHHYIDRLKNLDLRLPSSPNNCEHAWHLFVVRSKHRNRLQDFLFQKKIATLIHYPTPPHKQQAFYKKFINTDLSLTCSVAEEVLSLPIGPHCTDEHMNTVVNGIYKFMRMNKETTNA
jgi:dTDP-4-amino-4,6-dideoxygalactose transaminase